VQRSAIDWGFRIAPTYGENYRYTTAIGFLSNAYTYQNRFAGFDLPMPYGAIFIPLYRRGAVIPTRSLYHVAGYRSATGAK
jgi:hypothetical protein